ncbi:hypothetical protein [Microbacterium sp. NPDC087868]|uniref:hypothetical protein n=1 Tax=Microbacterium sp. NPDC087868 TaxID=3364195 RepID=UPI00384B9C6A
MGFAGFAQLSLIGARHIDTEILGRAGFTPLQQVAGSLSLALLTPYGELVKFLGHEL